MCEVGFHGLTWFFSDTLKFNLRLIHIEEAQNSMELNLYFHHKGSEKYKRRNVQSTQFRFKIHCLQGIHYYTTII